MGSRVGGRIASLSALGLVAFDPLILAQSRTLEAEAPQIAFSLVAVALALEAARQPGSRTAPVWALLAGAAAAYATLCKLTDIATFVPLLILLLCAGVERRQRRALALCALAGLLGVAVVLAAFVLPFLDDFRPLWRQVVEFHLAARQAFRDGPGDHARAILDFLVTAPVTYAAFFGAAVGIARRDPLVLPWLGWFLAIASLLVDQRPLFDHHLVTLAPALLALATLGFSRHRRGMPLPGEQTPFPAMIVSVAVLVAYAAAGTISHVSGLSRARSTGARNLALARDIARNIDPEGRIITDCQFAAALAQRRTPAALVDTSFVRVMTRYLTANDLIAAAARPNVKMVLFCGVRLDQPALAPFHLWVSRHFRLLRADAGGPQMWIKPSAPFDPAPP